MERRSSGLDPVEDNLASFPAADDVAIGQYYSDHAGVLADPELLFLYTDGPSNAESGSDTAGDQFYYRDVASGQRRQLDPRDRYAGIPTPRQTQTESIPSRQPDQGNNSDRPVATLQDISRNPDILSSAHPAEPPVRSAFTPPLRLEPNGTDDDLLDFLAENAFSSPSILASSSPHELHWSLPPGPMPQTRSRATAGGGRSTGASSRPSGASSMTIPEPPTAATRRSSTTQPAAGFDMASLSSLRWPVPPAPRDGAVPTDGRTSLKRTRSGEAAQPSGSQGHGGSQNNGASSSSQSQSQSNSGSQPNRPRVSPKRPKREEPVILDDDLFGSDDDVEVVNLTNVDRPHAASQDEEEAKAPVAPPVPSNRIKLAALQCVICMDDVTNLTVTHCGHVFCGECLHSSLHIDSSRRICPICRQKIEVRGPRLTASKMARSYFPLQLKVISKSRKGKQPARPSRSS